MTKKNWMLLLILLALGYSSSAKLAELAPEEQTSYQNATSNYNDAALFCTKSVGYGTDQYSTCMRTKMGLPEPNINQQSSTSNSTLNNSSLEHAKIKCSELGFKDGTEGFGKCTLRLSK